MTEATRRTARTVLRTLAVLSAVGAFIGFLAAGVIVLKMAANNGYPVPVAIPVEGRLAQQLFLGGLGALFGGLILNIVFNSAANLVAPPPAPADETPSSAEGATGVDYLAKLERTYAWLAGFVAMVVFGGVLGGSAAGFVSTGGEASVVDVAVSIALTFASVALQLFFGGVAGGVATIAVFLGLWYGARRGASEAILGGIALAVVALPTAFVVGSPGWAIFSVLLLYYNVRARGATEFVFVSPDRLSSGG